MQYPKSISLLSSVLHPYMDFAKYLLLLLHDSRLGPRLSNKNQQTPVQHQKQVRTLEIYLKAITANGTRITTEQFDVVENVDYVVERYDTSMRIYPISPYVVNTRLIVNKEFSGGIREKVPGGFEISEISADPINKTRAGLWTNLNDLKSKRPMVWINEIHHIYISVAEHI